MEERRLLAAVALSLLVLTGYSLWFSPKPPASRERGEPRAAEPRGEAAEPAEAKASAEAPMAREPQAVALVADEIERRIEVDAPDAEIAFSNRGARLLSWRLREYLDGAKKPEDVVPGVRGRVRPLDLVTGRTDVDERLRLALFKASAEMVEVRREEASLRFEYSDGEVAAEKTFVFRPRGLTRVEAAVRYRGESLPARLVWGPGLGNPTAEEKSGQGYTEPRGVALTAAGAIEHAAPSDLQKSRRELTAARWGGIESHYFAVLFVPAATSGLGFQAFELPGMGEEKAAAAAVAFVDLSGGPVQVYVGAKDHERLAALGHELERVVQVGDWIGPIVLVLMRLLRWVNGHVGNWGWSIVLLTLLINLVMAPFRHYSIVNGMKMAKIAPEMRAIQERYRKVPLSQRQPMQDEINALYARNGMSMGSQMLVGCLPMLLTMPFLFAFYRVLTVAVELRGAPFLWVSDLAQKDPLFVMPVAMGISMFVMQKMTPSAMDPAQQRIMMIMPLMLAFMFLWAPAGLNLYWLTSNLWSLGQQAVEMTLLGVGARKEKRAK